MNRRALARVSAMVLSFACCVAGAACSTSSGGASPAGRSCASDSDCSGGTVCGFANPDGGGAAECSSHPLGVCVVPVNPAPTMLCGCGGASVSLVVDDVDAGTFYWSGVIVGEQGFPPCGDAAIAPSSGDDASTDDGPAGDGAPGDGSPGDAAPPSDAPSDGGRSPDALGD